MKRIAFFILMCVTVAAPAEQSVTVAPVSALPSKLTTKNVNPDLVRASCIQAVRQEQSRRQEIIVDRVSVGAGKEDTIATCVVDAQLLDRDGSVGRNTYTRVTKVRYTVSVNLTDGETGVARIDENAAQDVALAALAAMYIDIRPTSESANAVTFTSIVAGRQCTVEVTADETTGPKHWLVSKLDCGAPTHRNHS